MRITNTTQLSLRRSMLAMMFLPVALVACVRMAGLNVFRIAGGSMEPSLVDGDYVIAVNARLRSLLVRTRVVSVPTLWLKRGDIIVFSVPGRSVSSAVAIKRVIGLPGDTLSMRDGLVYRNGRALSGGFSHRLARVDAHGPRPGVWHVAYLVPSVDRRSYFATSVRWGPIAVPPAAFFVLGDNRNDSGDSRLFGFVRQDEILARVLMQLGMAGGGGSSDIGREPKSVTATGLLYAAGS